MARGGSTTSQSKPVLLYSLHHPQLALTSPIAVSLEYDPDFVQVVAYAYDLNLFGYGDTELAALSDLRRTVADLYFELRDAQEHLLPHPHHRTHTVSMKIAEVLRAFDAFSCCGERLVLWTKVPHGRGQLKGRLPHYIRQQLRFNEEQFRKLVQCETGRQEYVEILRHKGFVRQDERCEE